MCVFSANGAGELYAYAPLTDNNEKELLSVPNSTKNKDYGISVGRGLFQFFSGEWTTVAMRVKLNTIGDDNGRLLLVGPSMYTPDVASHRRT